MGTTIRPTLSKKNKYWISKHRYYELKHFCLQYNEWRELYRLLDSYSSSSMIHISNDDGYSDKTADVAEKRELYFNYMNKIEQASLKAGGDIYTYLLKAVTNGLSYNNLKMMMNIPCSKDYYYERYRYFFWILDKIRN